MTVTLDLTRRSAPTSVSSIALQGARDITPMVLGVIPFGLAIGASIGTSSLSTAQGIATGPGVLAGAAQLSMVGMLDAGAAPLIIIVSALIINARLLLYSTSLAPWFADEPLGRRLMLALPVIDQLYFTCVPRFEQGDLDARGRRAYYGGAAAWLVGAWVTSQVLALVVGARLPDWLGLRIAAPLALAGLLAKAVDGRRAKAAALTAAVVTVIAAGLPFHSAVLVGTVAALVVGPRIPVLDVDREEVAAS